MHASQFNNIQTLSQTKYITKIIFILIEEAHEEKPPTSEEEKTGEEDKPAESSGKLLTKTPERCQKQYFLNNCDAI